MWFLSIELGSLGLHSSKRLSLSGHLTSPWRFFLMSAYKVKLNLLILLSSYKVIQEITYLLT